LCPRCGRIYPATKRQQFFFFSPLIVVPNWSQVTGFVRKKSGETEKRTPDTRARRAEGPGASGPAEGCDRPDRTDAAAPEKPEKKPFARGFFRPALSGFSSHRRGPFRGPSWSRVGRDQRLKDALFLERPAGTSTLLDCAWKSGWIRMGGRAAPQRPWAVPDLTAGRPLEVRR